MRNSGKLLYLISSAAIPGIVFARYVMFARVLNLHELGVVNLVVLFAFIFELLADFGADRYLVVNRHGNLREVQGAAHVVIIFRGLLIFALMLASAPVAAAVYRLPELFPAMSWLAVYAMIAGFTHSDFRRVQRFGNFSQEAIVNLSAEIVGLAGAVIGLLVFRNHMAIVVSMIARSCGLVIASQIVARRRYATAFSRPRLRHIALFSAPMALNGFIVYLAGQGDRLFIGYFTSPGDLGLYSSMLLLIFTPSAFIARYITNTQSPVIAKSAWTGRAAETIFRASRPYLVLALAMSLGFVVVAPVAAPLLFGNAFRLPLIVVGMIGVMQSLRFIQYWVSGALLALARPRAVLAVNVMRLVVLTLSIGLILFGGGLNMIVALIMLAELISFVVALFMLNRYLGEPTFAHILSSVTPIVIALVTVGGFCLALEEAIPLGWALAGAGLLSALAWFYASRDTILMMLGRRPAHG